MKKILVVNDEKLILKLAKRLLGKEGYQVNIAGTEKYALSLFKQIKFDLIISDLVLKETEGLSLLYGIRKKRPGTKTILMSGCELTKKQISMLKVDYFLHKPFDIDELIVAVNKVF